jgi:tetratricopeptide (TPR) repeat protein
LEIDDTLAEAHASLAFSEASFDWNWAGADAEFGRAIELNPDNATARDQHGTVLRVAGRREESIAKNKRAVELDPLSVPFRRDLGYAYYDARQYDQAIEQERKTLELDPNFNQARSILGRAYIQEAMYRQGIAEIEKELVISPADPNVLSELGRGYAMASRHAEAQNVIDQLIAVSKRSYVAPKNVAAIYAALGEKDKAFEWLEKAYQDRSLASGITLKSFPGFDSLRSDPRFADLLRRMNLQP